MTQTKQKSLDQLKTIVKDARAAGKKVVLANGCFDLIHAGHVSYLESAKKIGDILVVALNSDASVKLLKDERRPVIPEDQRFILGVSGNTLGENSYLGEEIEDRMCKFRIQATPADSESFHRLLPDRQAFGKISNLVHQRLLRLLRSYYYIGGMPEAVAVL